MQCFWCLNGLFPFVGFRNWLLKMFTVFKLHAPKAKFALVEMSRKRKENVSFLNIHPNRINERFSFHFISFHFVSFRLISSRLVSFHFIFLSSICGQKRLLLTFFTPLFMFIRLLLIHFAPPPLLLIDSKNSKWLTYFCILLCIIIIIMSNFLAHNSGTLL